MTNLERKLKIALNPDLIDKNEAGNASLFAHGWVNAEVTPDEFIAAVTQRGWAYCAQLGGSRKGSNFLACNVASVDVDYGLTVEEALANPFVRQHALLLYTTVRHSSNAHRFRVVFLLPEKITSPRRMRAINRGLTRCLGGDMAATDPTRISFGNRNAQVHRIDGQVGLELLRELIADAALPDNTDLPAQEIVSRRSVVKLPRDQELRLADGRPMLLCDALPRSVVHCPVHPDENPSAYVVQNRHGVLGVFCSTCAKSFWPVDHRPDDYDPDDFVKAAQAVAAAAAASRPEADASPSLDQLTPEPLTGSSVHLVSGRPAPNELLPGITLVRSKKGSGKTEAVKRLAARVKTALLVGHRRTLIRGSCKRMSFVCYLDVSKKAALPHSHPSSDATSLDDFLWEDEDDQ
ncbi:hypothetical protein [Methylobacterium frigidaeris]|uniref:Uncharacterized protein n=1 Tax=Methylobacterium frigidaeris TaxID=2038277 RepID=A0AA37HGR7_9HYPH|nr:hypothetical protein [Methylobacterium frigidaeris]GJD65630.1 hypothetical protein MPEAHAMD_5825 [Methylobacterium frigidaeris]